LVKSIEVINNNSLKLSLNTLSVNPGDVVVLHVNLDEIDFVDGTKYAKTVQEFFPKNEILVMPMNDMALQIVKKY
jgi:aminoglycoside N3'-acetyltransferase